MNKIIGGKKYDTETAKYLANWANGYAHNDPHYVAESLYRKRTGEFFLYGEGGAMTKYAETIADNLPDEGEQIIPLTDDEAKDWAESHLDDDEYKKICELVEE